MYMLFEGVNAESVHAIGLARSDDMGRSWTKERVPGKTEAGGPVFEAMKWRGTIVCPADNAGMQALSPGMISVRLQVDH